MHSLYRLCLRAYPAEFRQRHGAEMLQIFVAEWQAARAAGLRSTLALVVHIISDLARTAPHERLAATTHPGWLAFGTATFCGLTATWIQFAGKEMPATAVVFFTGTVFFSYFAGVRTWRWPVMVAAWLPAACCWARATEGGFEEWKNGFGLGLFLSTLAIFGWSLAISCAGTGVGVLLRRLFPLCLCRVRPVANEKP